MIYGRTTIGRTAMASVTIVVALVACGDAGAQSLYWRGLTDSAWNGSVNNWSTDKAGTAVATMLPGPANDVVFAWDGAFGVLSTTLEQDFFVNSLTFEAGTTTPTEVGIGPGSNLATSLTIGGGGLAIGVEGPDATISTPVVLGAFQTWSTAAGSLLTVSGELSGWGSLFKEGGGTLGLTGSNSHGGGTTLSGGTLRIGSDHALGTGPVTVSSGNGTLQAIDAPRTIANSMSLDGNLVFSGDHGFTLTGSVVQIGGNRTVTNNLTSGTLEIAGTMTLTEVFGEPFRVFVVNGSGPTLVSGTLANGPGGNSTFRKQGVGTLTVTGSLQTNALLALDNGLVVADGGSLSAGIPAALATGGGNTMGVGNTNGSSALLYVREGSLAAQRFNVGPTQNNSSVASIVLDGGSIVSGTTGTNGGGIGITLGSAAASPEMYSGLLIKSGSVNVHDLDLRSIVTSGGSHAAVFRMEGGGLKTRGFLVTRGQNAEVTITGGTIDRAGAAANLALGFQQTGTSVLNVVGGLIDNSGRDVTVRQFNQAGTTPVVSINLNDGRLITNSMLVTNAGGTGWVNFNGGTLEPGSDDGTLVASSMTAAYVNGAFGSFEGGAVIDTKGRNTTIAAPLVAPTGDGLAGLTLDAVGSGYIGAPYVRIDGGGGSGATGYATVDLDPASPTFGQLTGVVLTNPGVNYTSPPTITLLGGGGSGASVSVGALVPNTSGGLRKLGAGALSLASASTYNGATSVEQGTLILQAGGSITQSSMVRVDAGATFDVSSQAGGYAVPAQQILGGDGIVAGSVNFGGGATLSPGVSPGTLTVTGDVTLAAGGNYNWEITSATGGAGLITGWDLVAIGGVLNVTATSEAPFNINLWTLSSTGPDVNGPAVNFDSTLNYSWKIASATGGITGFAADNFLINVGPTNGTAGFANPIGGGTFSVAQAGNDLNLVFTAGGGPVDIVINVPTGQTQTQGQAGYPLLSGNTPVQKTGDGALVLDAANTLSASLAVNAGTAVAANTQAIGTATLDVAAGATFSISPLVGAANAVQVADLGAIDGRIDVATGRVALPASGESPGAELRSLLIAGRSGGTWDGTSGIMSSDAPTYDGKSGFAVGYRVAGDNSATVAWASLGDADLDGAVTTADVNAILTSGLLNTGIPGAVWQQGDFDYDGLVTTADINALLTTGRLNSGSYLPPTPPTAIGSPAAVPEPTTCTLTLAGLLGAGYLAVRRRPKLR
jgi:fibronectin-binding autotransporter adhesin